MMVGDGYTQEVGKTWASQPHEKVGHMQQSIWREAFQMYLDPKFTPVTILVNYLNFK